MQTGSLNGKRRLVQKIFNLSPREWFRVTFNLKLVFGIKQLFQRGEVRIIHLVLLSLSLKKFFFNCCFASVSYIRIKIVIIINAYLQSTIFNRFMYYIHNTSENKLATLALIKESVTSWEVLMKHLL